MPDISDQILIDNPRRGKISRFRVIWLIFIPLASIAFQVNIPLFFRHLGYLELPLLVTVYFSLMQRNPVGGTLIGAVIGLLQDALANQPLGIFGMVKTLVGYFAASISIKIDVDNTAIRQGFPSFSSSSTSFLLGFWFGPCWDTRSISMLRKRCCSACLIRLSRYRFF